ncbi:hypothetical protein N7539_006991 [Penicillium diatomitis]|uniref:Uncharacterized protein n=1 Tax=Penicillium diatomitis TaxID=2819901 RepID=A0A9W9X2R8_9EURO|nr:uncharacterized protein N7539_006991 [Penicillium diatomitis]KAJ5481097.1 hypothetical protein N7539_006991 [Penicillium diatomitis]
MVFAPIPGPETLLYGEREHRGRWFERWAKNPAAPGCKVARSDVTIADIGESLTIDRKPGTPGARDDEEVAHQMVQLHLEGPWVRHSMDSGYSFNDEGEVLTETLNEWKSYIAPSALFIASIYRSSGPYVSQIAQAMYQSENRIDTLKHVFFLDVINEDTVEFVLDNIFAEDRRPDGSRVEYHFVPGQSKFYALLGTKLGSVVASLVLGAYPRGTRHVSQIVVHREVQRCFGLQFDIDTIPASPPPPYSALPGGKHKRPRGGDGNESDDGGEPPKKRRKSANPNRNYDPSYQGPARRTRGQAAASKIVKLPLRPRKPTEGAL